MNKMWTLEEGAILVRRLQSGAFERGFNLSLGGGVLNKGESLHDIDIVAAPCKGGRSSAAESANLVLWFFNEIGAVETRHSRWNSCMWVVTAKDSAERKVDLFIVGEL